MKMKRLAIGLIFVWIIVQVVLIVVFWDFPLTGDCEFYNTLAIDSYNKGLLYPNDMNQLVVAEPLVNSLIAQLYLFGTYNTNKILNLLMNLGILWSLYQIGLKLFNKHTSIIGCCLFCMIYSNSVIVVGNRTEIPFVFFLLLSLAVIRPSTKYLILSGVCMGVAEWYRPLAPIFLPGIILYMWFEKYKKSLYITFLLSIAVCMIGIGTFNKQQTGRFFINPSTGGANLLMTANDKAYGGTALQLLHDPDIVPSNIDDYSTFQKDSVFKCLAKDWIMKHPEKYACLYVKKIVGLYIEDSWPDRSIMQSSGKLAEYILNKDYTNLLKMITLMFLKSIVYYIVLFLFVYSVYINRKEILSKKGTILLTLVLGTLATCIFVVSSTYHYPYMFAIILWAAYAIEKKYDSKKI